MAAPTAEQTRQLTKLGYAMPDGSYYIREGATGVNDLHNAILAVGRATPNAGESETERRNSVRRHIMKRARALKRTDMIPDSWNPDGSLKHSDLDEFLMHYGVMGMKWGHRKAEGSTPAPSSDRHAAKLAKLDERAKAHEQLSAAHAQAAQHAQSEAADLMKRGLQSTAFQRVYGKDAHTQTEWQFYGKNRQTRAEALAQTHNNLRLLSNQYTRSANHHAKVAKKLREKQARLQHTGIDEDVDEFLMHFGVKGMKWGVRKAPGSPAHSDAARAVDLQARVRSGGGAHVLSNNDLKALNERLNLESQYRRLTTPQASAGEKFAKELLVNLGKQEAQKGLAKSAEAGASWILKKYGRKK